MKLYSSHKLIIENVRRFVDLTELEKQKYISLLTKIARILGMSTTLKEDLLISEPLLKKLKISEMVTLKGFGSKTLTDKTKSIGVYAIRRS